MNHTPHRVFGVVLALVTFAAQAEVIEIYVAARDTPAAKAAEPMADGKTKFWFPKLPRAFEKVAELLNGTEHEVRVNVAKADDLPAVALPNGLNGAKAKLLILGGWCDDWKKRDPFTCASAFTTGEGRNTGFLSFGGNKTLLDTLVVSGFVMNAAPSNKYDAKTNSLLKGTSSTTPLMGLSQVVVKKLVVADNVFVNGAHRAFEVYHSPASNEAEVEIVNNFVLNTVIPFKFSPALYKGFLTRRVRFANNSVIMNWPFNPDSTSSNVGALELYHKDCCSELVVEGNLFAFNFGGAMQHDWPTNRMGKLALRNNLFFKNAQLFGDDRAEAGVFTGKFGTNPKYAVIALAAHMEDDYPYEFSGNVSLDPGLSILPPDLLAADSNKVEADKTKMNEVRQLVGANQQGGTVAIKNYAPRLDLDLTKLPFPTEAKAKAFGVQKDKLFAPSSP
ncbi:MAG: hypothetical protein JNM17_04530 [Archangium sp.]|nr:hypothetical protein [Archangium sp.]